MADDNVLAEILGGILVALAHARRVADEQTVAIAEYYRREPLLAGLSVPRIRVPQLEVEIPVVIKEFSEGSPPRPSPTSTITDEMIASLREATSQEGVQLPQALEKSFQRLIQQRLDPLINQAQSEISPNLQEAIAREAQRTFIEVIEGDQRQRLNREQVKRVSSALREAANRTAIAQLAVPPNISVEVVTAAVKDHADPQSVSRIKLVLREDGVEWTTVERQDGTLHGFLVPE